MSRPNAQGRRLRQPTIFYFLLIRADATLRTATKFCSAIRLAPEQEGSSSSTPPPVVRKLGLWVSSYTCAHTVYHKAVKFGTVIKLWRGFHGVDVSHGPKIVRTPVYTCRCILRHRATKFGTVISLGHGKILMGRLPFTKWDGNPAISYNILPKIGRT